MLRYPGDEPDLKKKIGKLDQVELLWGQTRLLVNF